MRPDRLVVGECRGAEIVELLAAMNTGHDGEREPCTARGSTGVGARLEALGALAGLGPDALGRQVRAAVDLVVHLGRDDGGRRVERIGRFAGARRPRGRAGRMSPPWRRRPDPAEVLDDVAGAVDRLVALRARRRRPRCGVALPRRYGRDA